MRGAKAARHLRVLHVFKDDPDGAEPYAGLILRNGVLYGTTYRGGDRNDAGTVYQIGPSGGYSIIHRFVRRAPFGQRANPEGGVVADAAGSLYGTTLEGGTLHRGTVYEVTWRGRVTTLHTFTGPDGEYPADTLLRDAAGNLYGTTQAGGIDYGNSAFCEAGGCGTVFKIDTANHESVLYSFTGGVADGNDPYGGVVRDRQGNLYGTTMGGGTADCAGEGCGIAFKIDRNDRETILHRFTDGPDGGHPGDTLLLGSDGNLYGTGDSGGTNDAGVVFEIDTSGGETVLYHFTGGSDGANPFGSLIQDAAGNFFGTTEFGGGSTACQLGCGTVFELNPNGHETLLYSFTGKRDGAYPLAGVTMDPSGYLYGTAPQGGNQTCANGLGCGVAFRLKP